MEDLENLKICFCILHDLDICSFTFDLFHRNKNNIKIIYSPLVIFFVALTKCSIFSTEKVSNKLKKTYS